MYVAGNAENVPPLAEIDFPHLPTDSSSHAELFSGNVAHFNMNNFSELFLCVDWFNRL
jgi:hypothetical protein